MQPPTQLGGDLQGGPQAADATNLPRNTILIGDVRERVAELPAAPVDTVITSPPYFGVRDYGHERQLGAEPDVDGWVSGLQLVARDLARVLRPTGSLWLNLGDSYARRRAEGATPKSLLLGPARVALALVHDGRMLRNEVIWAKTTPMPSSVTDRLTTTHELIYFDPCRRWRVSVRHLQRPRNRRFQVLVDRLHWKWVLVLWECLPQLHRLRRLEASVPRSRRQLDPRPRQRRRLVRQGRKQIRPEPRNGTQSRSSGSCSQQYTRALACVGTQQAVGRVS